MYTLLSIIAIIASILLVIMVLLQSSKGGGLAGISGGATGNFGTMFGSRRTADFLSKSTWWLASIILGLALVVNLFFLPGSTTTEQRESIIQSSGQQVPTVPSTPTLPEATQQSDDNSQSQTPAQGDDSQN